MHVALEKHILVYSFLILLIVLNAKPSQKKPRKKFKKRAKKWLFKVLTSVAKIFLKLTQSTFDNLISRVISRRTAFLFQLLQIFSWSGNRWYGDNWWFHFTWNASLSTEWISFPGFVAFELIENEANRSISVLWFCAGPEIPYRQFPLAL